MSTKQILQVRRQDLLEQLQDRFEVIKKDRAIYEAKTAKYEKALEKYNADVEAYKEKIEKFMLSLPLTPEYSGGTRYDRDIFTVRAEISMSLEEIAKKIGKPPKDIGAPPERPAYLSSRYQNRVGTLPCMYDALDNAIKLLFLSDDYYVPSSIYQFALEVL